ncbi:hypothetical protein LB505_012668 [Fusarium chuoi]|nr:hypothetical protein LB505_012668 [Fusarium chuoi]
MVVGHGTFLRCLWTVWAYLPVDAPISIQFETGSVATFRYVIPSLALIVSIPKIQSYKDSNIDSRTAVIGLKM